MESTATCSGPESFPADDSASPSSSDTSGFFDAAMDVDGTVYVILL